MPERGEILLARALVRAHPLTGIVGADTVAALLAEYDRLRAIEKRLEETTTWCGVDQMHRAIEYIRTGSTPEARALLGATDTTVDSGPGAVRDRTPDPRAVDFDRCPEPPIDERIGATDTTPPEPAPMPEFPTNDDRICANAIAEALARRYGHVLLSLCYRSARQVMDVCGEWAAAADAREAAGTAELYGDEVTAHDHAIDVYDEPDGGPTDAEFEAFRAAITEGHGTDDPLKLILQGWACTACGRPMNPTHAAVWMGPDAPRHGNCANYAEEPTDAAQP